MGTDDFFKKRKAAASKRKVEERTPKPNSYLIISEGAKTEPLYFDGVKEYVEQKYGSSSYCNLKPSQCDPCTKVQHLILELKPYISDLLE